MKRQYFKPTMDGDWVNKPDESQQGEKPIYGIKRLKAINLRKNSNSSQIIQVQQQLTNDPNQNLTVTSLGLSLISLFDRLKETICDMIQYECPKNSKSY